MKANGARVLVNYLEQEGVSVVFGVPGGHLLGFYDALIGSSIDPVLAKHESGAAYMAAGFAQVGQRLGVCCATVGPGATNMVSGVAAAYMQSLPILAITAQVGTVNLGKGALQEAAGLGRTFSQVKLFSNVCKHSEMVMRVERLPEAIRNALRIAYAGRPGPVHLDIPADVFRGEVDHTMVPIEEFRPTFKALCLPDQLADAIHLLAQAERPAILVGGGGRVGTAPAAILAIAERLAIPVATTLQGKGAIPEDHPLALGCMGLYGTHAANRYMRGGLDVLLVIGASLHEVTTHVWDPSLEPSKALIQIDVDANEIGKNYPVTIGLLGRAQDVMEQMLLATEQEGPVARRSLDHLSGLKASTNYFADAQMVHDGTPIKPQRAIAEIRKCLSDETIVFTDIGNSMTWVERDFCARRPDTVMSFGGLAAMGSGVAAGIGGKLAAPDRACVVICGDGDFMMHGMEVMTAVSHAIPVVWIILENGALGMIKDVQTMNYQGRTIASRFALPDFTLLAESFGAQGYRADSPGEIGSLLAQALDQGRPAILTIPIDPDEMPPTKPRMLAIERSMGLPPPHKSLGIGAIKALIGMFRER